MEEIEIHRVSDPNLINHIHNLVLTFTINVVFKLAHPSEQGHGKLFYCIVHSALYQYSGK